MVMVMNHDWLIEFPDPRESVPGFPEFPLVDDTKHQVELSFHVNKTTHRIRFENETESSVDVVIERKD